VTPNVPPGKPPILIAVAAGAWLAAFLPAAQADPALDAIYAQFQAGKYETTYRALKSYRSSHPATSLIDYMLGVSACRSDRAVWGADQLTVARAQYREREPAGDKLFAEALQACQAAPVEKRGGGGHMHIVMKRQD
jgi:hypothetical protein